MQVFKTRSFSRFAKHEEIADSSLREAIDRAEKGLIDADLGGGLIKQRIARPGRGRSGGYRLIVAHRTKARAVFLLGFAKNEKENISQNELALLRELGRNWLGADALRIRKEIETGNLQEVEDGGKA